VLSPKQASLFDIEYMLVDGHDVIYKTKTGKSIPYQYSRNLFCILGFPPRK
jgi:hypothetical protein